MKTASFLGLVVLVSGCHPSSPPPAAPPASSASSAPLPEPLATAAARIRALVAHYDDAALATTFTPEFVADKSADMKRIFGSLGARVGACTGERAIDLRSDQEGILEIDCEKAVLKVSIVADAAPPHLMSGLLLHTKPR